MSAPARAAVGWVVALVFTAVFAGQPSAFASNELETYVVQPGDTLVSIATAHGIPLERLVEINGLGNPEKIKPGDVLRLRDEQRDSAASSSNETRSAQLTPTTSFYEVQPGDTLYSIARKLGVEPAAILAANNRDNPDLLRPGDRIAIPGISIQPSMRAADGASLAVQVGGDRPGSTELARSPTPVVIAGAPTGPLVTATPGTGRVQAPVPTRTIGGGGAPTPTPGPSASYAVDSSAAGRILSIAMPLRGASYVYGGVSPDGFDCSGFTYFVFNRAGIPVSRDLTAQYQSGVHPSRDHLVPGDLVFFQNTYMPGLSHSGIYMGNGEFIHANNEDSGVTVSRLNAAYWESRWYGAARPHGN